MEENCPFCLIAAGKKEADIIYADETLLAFRDIHPHAPVHVLIVPKKHIRSVNDLTPADRDIIAAMFMKAPEIAEEMGVARSGYRLAVNVERGAGQIIFHLHLHLTGGWR